MSYRSRWKIRIWCPSDVGGRSEWAADVLRGDATDGSDHCNRIEAACRSCPPLHFLEPHSADGTRG